MDKEVPIVDGGKSCEEENPSEVEKLGEDLLALIFDKVDESGDRKSLSLVCKQWLRVEGANRLVLHVLELNRLPNFLSRFPNLLECRASIEISNDLLQFLVKTCPRIEVLNLNLDYYKQREGFICVNVGNDDFDDEGLCYIAEGLPNLDTVSLRGRYRIGSVGVASLGKFSKNLRVLDLGWCRGVSNEALESIAELKILEVLNLQSCDLITDEGLGFLADGYVSNTLKSLNLCECDQITDCGMIYLNGMGCLEELSLEDCGGNVSDLSIETGIAMIMTLKKLDLSFLANVSDESLVALSKCCRHLEVLVLTDCEMVTAAGVGALSGCKSLRELVLIHSQFYVSGDLLEHLVVGCPALECIALDHDLKAWIPKADQEKLLKRNCRIDWK